MRGLVSLLVGFVIVGATGAVAQQSPSLADVARREAERRKGVSAPVKVYTNADVKRLAPASPPPATSTKSTDAPQPTPNQVPAATATSPASAAQSNAAAPAEPARDEAWYRKQAAALREELSRNRLFAEALQSRINALWADFTSRDDPAQRTVIERDRNEALAELDRVRRELTRIDQSTADFEEEARKAGVPPGWLR